MFILMSAFHKTEYLKVKDGMTICFYVFSLIISNNSFNCRAC